MSTNNNTRKIEVFEFLSDEIHETCEKCNTSDNKAYVSYYGSEYECQINKCKKTGLHSHKVCKLCNRGDRIIKKH